MAHRKTVTLLGYHDEPITDHNRTLVDFTTNKVGGLPDSSCDSIKIVCPPCTLCQLPRLLIVQIYAPIESSTYHRTLYVFACINPNCWNHSESWICLRSQCLDTSAQQEISAPTTTTTTTTNATDWHTGADDWDDANSNIEENGNTVVASDDEDESASMDDSLRIAMEQIDIDDNNANEYANEARGGAVGALQSPVASADIEGAEGEVVTIDTPTYPQRDVASILHESTHLPYDLFQKKTCPQFSAFFMNVYEECDDAAASNSVVDRHVRDLLHDYQKMNNDYLGGDRDDAGGGGGNARADCDLTIEKYEKSYPAHGDKMLHVFLMRIRRNPGHFLRYIRNNHSELLLHPLQEYPKTCTHCGRAMIFEFQLLPTLIPQLKLAGDQQDVTRLEFGNVLVYTCAQSCWSSDSSVVQECVVVQRETM